MITITSLLDYLKKEDSLMKECDRNFDRQAILLHAIDDAGMYNIPKDELQKYKDEVLALEKQEDEIREELKKVRASMRRYVVKLFDI